MRDLVPNGNEGTSTWAFRLAVAAALSAVPLVLFGGSVTTLGAGMAVDGWWVAEGHFLLLFPVEEWFRDTATFVEHTHRLFGVLVGAFSIGALVLTLRGEPRRSARFVSTLALLLVALQGTLGGLRVLERDPRLAFLHGALAQAVFACLCASAFLLSPSFRRSLPPTGASVRDGDRRAAGVATLAVYAGIVAGAWYRHGIRPTESASASASGRFALHVLSASIAVACLGRLMIRLQETRDPIVARARRRTGILIGIQVLLGLCAWTSRRPDAVGPVEWGLTIAHVLCGGLLLSQTAMIWMWLGRSRADASEGTSEAWMSAPGSGGAERA